MCDGASLTVPSGASNSRWAESDRSPRRAGWLRRKWGLSCDNLVSAQIVTADGSIITATPDETPDLYWGIRGGGNFGVVTMFEYRLHPVGPDVMFCFTLYPARDGKSVLRGWRDFLPDLTRRD